MSLMSYQEQALADDTHSFLGWRMPFSLYRVPRKINPYPRLKC